ncbi:hypothetical protein AAF712_009743 [Marasmius tenuissimus]|uniref:Uncharacterized protein n=1 Tax=Marasmius tenuissimus TaxID=585030 RepID=A0ABR2ZRK3_9AGAR
MAQLMLRRSKNAPLHIVWSDSYGDSRILEDALARIHRIASLTITATNLLVNTPLTSLTDPAPRLASLKLSSPGHTTITLPPNFLGNHTPNLRTVEFFGPISTETPLLRNDLTTLTVDCEHHLRSISRERFVEILRCLPNLETVSLPGTYRGATELSLGREQLYLRRLRSMRLTRINVSFLCDVLDKTSFPSPPHFSLHVDTEAVGFSVAENEISRLFASVGRVYESENNPYFFTSLKVRAFTVVAYACDIGETCEVLDCPGCTTCMADCPTLEISYGFQSDAHQRILTRSLLLDEDSWAVLPFREIRSLEMGQDYIAELFLDSLWRVEYFQAFERLSTVKIEGSRLAEHFVGCFSKMISTSTDARLSGCRQDVMGFPALRALELKDVSFDDVLFNNFLAALRFRLDYGAPLQKLVLDECDGLLDDDLRLFQELVADVKIRL